jgi:hypothetical protein
MFAMTMLTMLVRGLVPVRWRLRALIRGAGIRRAALAVYPT